MAKLCRRERKSQRNREKRRRAYPSSGRWITQIRLKMSKKWDEKWRKKVEKRKETKQKKRTKMNKQKTI